MKERVRNLLVVDLPRLILFVGTAIFVTSVLAAPSPAQTDPLREKENRTLELVDDLKDLLQKADRDETPEPWLIPKLHDLVRRYDWPWRVSLLHDDFRDGDYAYNPAWAVNSGEFRVVEGSGLKTVFDTTRQDRYLADRRGENPADILEEMFAGAIEREERDELVTLFLSAAEIYTQLDISAAFAVKLLLKSEGQPDAKNRIEFGPYLGDERDLGYRLAYEPGTKPLISLLRIAPGRSTVIEKSDQALEVEDGGPHVIEWHRRVDGEMVVLWDDKEIIRTVDRAYGDWFDGFNVINKGGDYELKEISIFGAHR